jgi:ribose-phosphate pyrophosphokinase
MDISHFSDGEVRCEINEAVREDTVFIIQSTCAPANDTLMELLTMVDAFKRSAVVKVVAVIPYYGYARQDRRPQYTRTPITSRLVADCLQVAGVDQIIFVDLHSEQQQGFFKIPTTNVSAVPIMVADIYRKYQHNLNDLIIVSPDTGGVPRARAVAKKLNDTDLAIIDKRRPRANVSQVMNIIGDVDGKNCVIVDDMIDTAGTLCKAAEALANHGAKSIDAYATHPVFSGNAYDNINESVLNEVVVTDTIPLSKEKRSDKIRVISVAGLLAETMRRINDGQSVSAIYM